jgi:thioredoxin-dependent peroxiredoxin
VCFSFFGEQVAVVGGLFCLPAATLSPSITAIVIQPVACRISWIAERCPVNRQLSKVVVQGRQHGCATLDTTNPTHDLDQPRHAAILEMRSRRDGLQSKVTMDPPRWLAPGQDRGTTKVVPQSGRNSAMAAGMERTGVTTFRDRPVTLVGPEIKVGDQAPDFTVLANDFSPVNLASAKGSVRVFSVVPSLDTSVCDAQTRRFNEELASLDGISVLAVSVDLPFAQQRWCGAAGIDAVQTVSDYRDLSFGHAYGVLVKELRLLARSVFVVDRSDTVVHAEYVSAIGRHPDYAAAFKAARAAL